MRAPIQSDNPASLPDGIAPSVPLQYFSQLQRQMTRANYEPLYDDAKTLLCCTLADGVQKAWIAYTVASTFAGLPRPKVSKEMFILRLHLMFQVVDALDTTSCRAAALPRHRRMTHSRGVSVEHHTHCFHWRTCTQRKCFASALAQPAPMAKVQCATNAINAIISFGSAALMLVRPLLPAALLCIMLTIRALHAARGYTKRAPPPDAQYIVSGANGHGSHGGPPLDSSAGSPQQVLVWCAAAGHSNTSLL